MALEAAVAIPLLAVEPWSQQHLVEEYLQELCDPAERALRFEHQVFVAHDGDLPGNLCLELLDAPVEARAIGGFFEHTRRGQVPAVRLV